MINKLNIILIFVLFFAGCQDDSSNPLLNSNKEFEIAIPDEDAEELHTVGQLRQYIEDNL